MADNKPMHDDKSQQGQSQDSGGGMNKPGQQQGDKNWEKGREGGQSQQHGGQNQNQREGGPGSHGQGQGGQGQGGQGQGGQR